MKNLISVLLILALSLALLISCTPNTEEDKGSSEGNEDMAGRPIPHSYNGDDEEIFCLVGEVTAIHDCIEVNVTEAEYAYGIYRVLVSDETDILDQNGSKISLGDIKVGDTVEVLYNGQTMMSYPPQIVAIRVVLR